MKTAQRVVASLLLSLMLIFGLFIGVNAEPNMSTGNTTTDPSGDNSGGGTGTLSTFGPSFYIDIVNAPVTATDPTEAFNQVYTQLVNWVKTGQGVFSGRSYGAVAIRISMDDNGNITSISSGGSVTKQWISDMFNAGIPYWKDIDRYRALLGELSPSSVQVLDDFLDGKSNVVPVIIWTICAWESYTDGSSTDWLPSTLAPSFDQWWLHPVASNDFQTWGTGMMNGCTLNPDRHWVDRWVYGWDSKHWPSSKNERFTKRSLYMISHYNYININGDCYYGRCYILPFDGEIDVNITPDPTDSPYIFSVKALPKDQMSDFEDGVVEKSCFRLYFSADEEALLYVNQLPATSNIRMTINVTPTRTNSPDATMEASLNGFGSTVKFWCIDYGPDSTSRVAKGFDSEIVTSAVGRTDIATNGFEVTVTAHPEDFKNLLEQSWNVGLGFEITDPNTNIEALYHTMKFEVKIEIDGVVYDCYAGNIPGCYNTGWKIMDGGRYGTNWASFITPGKAVCLPWSFETQKDITAYGEIVANIIGNPDWNVGQGVPSTENLAVAMGGQTFNIDMSGYVHGFGTPIGSLDNGDQSVGSANSSAAITRNITFNVIITDIWGSDNPRCSLSCPTHTFTHECAGNYQSGGCNTHNAPDINCDKCGAALGSAAGCSFQQGDPSAVPPIPDTPCNNSIATNKATTTGTATFNCSTNTWTHSSSSDCGKEVSFTEVTGTLDSYKQRYTNASCTWSCAHCGSSGTWQYTASSEQCLGYTTGYGCTGTHPENCVHHGTKTFTYTLVESVDTYAYREVVAAKVYALEASQIASVNTTLIDNSYVGQSTSNLDLMLNLWLGKGSYNGSNGRVWFTQFKNPNYNQWTSTSVTGGNGTDYWLGNTVVTLTCVANQKVGQMGSPEALDAVTVENSNGRTNRHWTEDSSHGTTTYQSQNGDWLVGTEAAHEAQHVVNAWQAANKANNYTAIVVSDQMAITISLTKDTQNILAETYAVDAGISLFNCGFSDSVSTYYRNHKNVYGNTTNLTARMIGYSFWDKYDDFMTIGAPETMVVGFIGANTDNPSAKYTITNRARNGFENSLLGGLYTSTGLGQYTSNGEIWSLGETARSGIYSQKALPTDPGAGIVQITTDTAGTTNWGRFEGYYHNFDYHNMGNFNVGHSVNGTRTSDFTVSNLGSGNYNDYGVPLVISNILMKQNAPNGLYSSPIKVNNMYVNVLSFNVSSRHSGDSGAPALSNRETTIPTKFMNSYSSGTLNDVVIHDPVSTQYWAVIGNGYGDYDGNGPAIDERFEDQRISTAGMSEQDKANYVVIGNTFHVWVSDFGDFRDQSSDSIPMPAKAYRGTGNGNPGADSNTGVINSSAKGYVDNMNTGRWVKNRYVSFGFPVSYYDTNGNLVVVPASTWINLNNVRACLLTNDYGYYSTASNGSATQQSTNGVFHAPTSALQNEMSWDNAFKYGMDFEFTVLTSAVETKAADIRFLTVAINDNTDGTSYMNENRNVTRAGNLAADSTVIQQTSVEMVGRIGNLALEDVGDFRFSTLFKQAQDSWLIPGVVKTVNSDYPVNILSVDYDILGDLRGHTTSNQTHATLSVTNYTIGSATNLGKAGSWIQLPLVASQNPIPEFKTEQMRMGYSAYFDIETIGNYYGINRDEDGNYIDGPTNIQEDYSSIDERGNIMVIKPMYYLYDYEEGKFYAIDMYAGSMGNYTKFYSSTDAANNVRSVTSALYIDLPNEGPRRNVTQVERDFTSRLVIGNGRINRAAYLKADYIGTPMEIVLDMNDLDYIGSSYFRSGIFNMTDMPNSGNQLGDSDMFTGWTSTVPTLTADEFINQSQRWYFTLNVPSSTVITHPSVGSRTQRDIVSNHEELERNHPNSVVVCFLDITVTGTVFELHYDALSVNKGVPLRFRLFDEVKPDNWDPEWDNEIVLEDETLDVFGEDGVTVVDEIDPSWPPVIVHDPFDTSAKDLETYGTH